MLVPLRCLVVACVFAHAAGYTARSHRAYLSLLAADTAVEGKGPSGEEKATTTTCSKCGFNDKGVGNCCSKGGAWQGTCKEEGGEHTFVDGFNACIGANKMAAPPDLSDVVASEHGSEPETMPSLYAGAFEADKSVRADEKKHQFEAKGSSADVEPAAPAPSAPAEAAPAEAAPAEAQQAAPPAAEAAPKLPALEDMPADAQQQAAAPAAAAEQAAAPKAAAPSKNADAVSAAEDEYMKKLAQPEVDPDAILDDPDAEGRRKQKLAEAKAAEKAAQGDKPAADSGPMSEASQKVNHPNPNPHLNPNSNPNPNATPNPIPTPTPTPTPTPIPNQVIDDYNDAWKQHNEMAERTKCQAPDGTPLPCEQVLA